MLKNLMKVIYDEVDILETCEVHFDSSEIDYNDSELDDDANNDNFLCRKRQQF